MLSSKKKRLPKLEKLQIENMLSKESSIDIPRKTKLSRETRITISNNTNKQSKEYIITYDDINAQTTENNILGSGRFGVVWKIDHKESKSKFAVKRISNNSIESNGMIMDLDVPLELGNECPFIIKFYGAIDAESFVWILNEVMDTSLDRFYVKSFELNLKLNELFLSKVALAVLSALNFMKSKNFMHRDIKPSNILINKTGEIKVCDFGISGVMVNSVNFTFIGSQCYMPPEKINLLTTGYTIKADIWSLGISLIEIATNKHPFAEANYLQVLNKVTSETEPSPKLPDQTIFDENFHSFINKCLFKDVKKRFNCLQLAAEPFIKKHLNEHLDLAFLEAIINQIQ